MLRAVNLTSFMLPKAIVCYKRLWPEKGFPHYATGRLLCLDWYLVWFFAGSISASESTQLERAEAGVVGACWFGHVQTLEKQAWQTVFASPMFAMFTTERVGSTAPKVFPPCLHSPSICDMNGADWF